jgi:GAF domain-containing protein/CheY-like chemotaxis protein/HAMP domain-containing protein
MSWTNQAKSGQSVQRYILRRVFPIIMAVFALLGVAGALGIQAIEYNDLSQAHEATLVETAQQIFDRELEAVVADLQTIAIGPAEQEFALETERITKSGFPPGDGLIDGQLATLRDFLEIVNRRPDLYLAVRFVTRVGLIWSEVTNFDGIQATNPSYQEDTPMSQLFLEEALALRAGEVGVEQTLLLPLDPTQQPVPVLRFSSPVAATTGNILGVVQVDVAAEPIAALAERLLSQEFGSQVGRRLLIVNQRGEYIVDTTAPDLSFYSGLVTGQTLSLAITDPELNSYLRSLSADSLMGQFGEGLVSVRRVELPNVPNSFWYILLVDRSGFVPGQFNTLSVAALAGSLAAGLLLTGVVAFILRRTLKPLDTASALAQQLADGQPGIAPAAPPSDPMGELFQAFEQITERMNRLQAEMSAQTDRTTRNLEIAARIGRQTATLSDVDVLMKRTIDLICDEFGFYHAQVFLVDDIGMNAVLAYSRGETGEKLLAQGHKIPVGFRSVIGQVTGSGKPVIVNDTASDASGIHAFNPLLPDTRAELALPLQIGDKVIGALDIQSTTPNVFHENEISAFQLLADQVAIALHNARLLTQSQQRITQIDTLNRRLTRVAWEDTLEKMGVETDYRYNLLDVQPVTGEEDDGVIEAMSAPIAIRGEVIGTIAAAAPAFGSFTEGDQLVLKAIADRVALAIENARLFQETQRSLAETSTLYQMSRFLNEANTLDELIAAIIRSVMTDATSGQIWVFDDYPAGTFPEWLELSAHWTASADGTNPVGMRLYIPDSHFLSSLSSSQPTLIYDTERDTRLDDHLRGLFRQWDARATVIVPFNVRGVWRGIITVEFPQPRQFVEREGRIYSALIDQAGVAIDNRLLLQQTEMTLSQIERLYVASRIINTAQDLPDLVRAAVSAANDPQLNFGLAMLEGELDSTGWPTKMRVVAESVQGQVRQENRVEPYLVPVQSPLRHREPEILVDEIPDEGDAPPALQRMRQAGHRFMATFPLFSANQPIAIFYATSRELQVLSARDFEVYYALTGQMSTFLEKRRLAEKTDQALDETLRLYAASRAIASAQDFNTVYTSAAEHLAQGAAQVSRIAIYLAGPDPTPDAPYVDCVYAWTRQAEAGGNGVGIRISSEAAPFAQLIRQTIGTLYYKHLDQDLADQPRLRQTLQQNNASSIIIASIQSRGKWFGVLTCESEQPDGFSGQYIRFVQAITDQVAIAVENQQLFEEAQLEAQRALALAEVGQLATRIGADFERNINEVFARVAEPANYDRWLLMLVDDENPNLLAGVAQQMPGMEMMSLDLTVAEHSLADAVRNNKLMLVNAPASYPAFLGADSSQLESIGKHIAAPVRVGGNVAGAILVGRRLDAADLDERDEQLVSTLAAQVAVAVENRRLFQAAEQERRYLRSLLDTMPSGVLVLDPVTYRPIQANKQVELLLQQPVNSDAPFNVVDYNLYRTGTNVHYPEDELPIFAAARSNRQVFSDDLAVMHADGTQTDLLMNAVPLHDARGNISVIVAAIQDISNLRGLENALQDNLQETIALYEATRSLAEANEMDEVLDTVIIQLGMLGPTDSFIVMLDEMRSGAQTVRALSGELLDLPAGILHARNKLFIEDVEAAPDIDDATRAELLAMAVRALISIPLLPRGREAPLGWLVVVYDQPHSIRSEDERFLTTLADSATTAIDNRNLFQSTQTALQETAAIYNATSAISRASDMNDLTAALEAALGALGANWWSGYLLMGDTESRLKELFSVAPEDAEPLNFHDLIVRHDLLRDTSFFIEDLDGIQDPSPLEHELQALSGVRALASVSLRVKDAPNGRLFLAYQQPRRFGDGDIRYLNALVDSTAVVIDNILLFDQIQSALEETSILYQASRSLADASSPGDILDAVVNQMIQPHVNHVFLALLLTPDWNGKDSLVQVAASWQRDDEGGINLQGVTLSADQFPAWPQLSSPTILTIDNIQEDESLSDMERIGIESLDARSLAVIPLRAGNRPIGAIWMGSREAHRHTDRELRVFQAFAEQASLSMEASRLLQQAERRARQLAASADVSQIASSILDLNVLLPRVVDLIKDVFNYDHVQVFLMDSEHRFAELRASTGEAGQQLLAIKHKLEKGSASVIGQVTARGEPVIALDTADASVVHRPNPYLPLTRSEMALPLIIKGQVVGALDVQSNQANAFTEEDVTALTVLAAQIATSIDNARLFEQSERRASDMSFLFTVATVAASAETLADALQNVAELLRDSLETLSVGIYLPRSYQDGEGNTFTVIQPIALAGSDQPLSEVAEVRMDDPNNTLAVVAASFEPTIIADTLDAPGYLPIAGSARSAVLVPLVLGVQFVGMIVMEDEAPNAYDQETLTLLLTLAGTLSAIIQNAQLLETVQKTNEQLRELDRLKSDFLANMSHELRTPLNSIIGFSRVILKGIDGPLTEMQEQDLTTIYNSGQHLLGLINDILDQAKIAAGKMDLQCSYFDIKPVIEGVRSIGIGLVKDKPINLSVEMASGLPKAYGDEFRTRQVLLNLVSNATKFTPQGSVTIRAYTEPDPETGKTMIRIDVTDTGIGIAEKDMPLLFEAFRQVDSSLTRTVGGTGLGLPIAKSLVEMQGGRMLVQSKVNVGSTFSITIPVDAPETEGGKRGTTGPLQAISEEPKAVSESQAAADPTPVSEQRTTQPMVPVIPVKRQVLVIEDNPDMVDQFRRILQREGFDVFAASIPLEAEAMASGLRPTLIVMDVNFAGGAGWNILTRLKERDDTFDVPVIVVSLNDESQKVMEKGAFGFIQRPFMPEQLLELVREAEKESATERILIIDDNPESARLLKQLLDEHGHYRVFTAEGGQQGVSMVARRRPDLVILDLRMPDMDGFAVLQELRSNHETANIPVLVVTGDTVNESEQGKLADVEVMLKVDIGQEAYERFIREVRNHLSQTNGGRNDT